jgi:hypothetical protein
MTIAKSYDSMHLVSLFMLNVETIHNLPYGFHIVVHTTQVFHPPSITNFSIIGMRIDCILHMKSYPRMNSKSSIYNEVNMDFPLIQLYVKCGCKHNYFLILIIEHLD